MRTRISVFLSKAALRHSQRRLVTFSIFTILCRWKAIIRAHAFMHSFHKNHRLATKVTPIGAFLNAAYFTFLLITYSIILFTTLGPVTRFFSTTDTQSKAKENINGANSGPRHLSGNLKQKDNFSGYFFHSSGFNWAQMTCHCDGTNKTPLTSPFRSW